MIAGDVFNSLPPRFLHVGCRLCGQNLLFVGQQPGDRTFTDGHFEQTCPICCTKFEIRVDKHATQMTCLSLGSKPSPQAVAAHPCATTDVVAHGTEDMSHKAKDGAHPIPRAHKAVPGNKLRCVECDKTFKPIDMASAIYCESCQPKGGE